MSKGRPDRRDHKEDTFSADPCLNTVPNAGHDSTIKDRPQCAPNPEGGTIDDRKIDVVHGTDTTSQTDEEARDRVANPDTNPCLPP